MTITRQNWFKVNDRYSILCDAWETRSSWGHTATLFINGVRDESVKVRYYNRTWEKYTFDSAMFQLAEKVGGGLRPLIEDMVNARQHD